MNNQTYKNPDAVDDVDDSDRVVIMKKDINNLIWMHCDSELTLEEAEERACATLALLLRKPKETP